MNLAQKQNQAVDRIPALDRGIPDRLSTATFALGWFWGSDSRFGSLAGVWRTRVGYAGGQAKSPTYRNIGDHAEAIEIDYDPAVIAYDRLLQEFWTAHRPIRPSFSRQYASIIFTRTDLEGRLAQDSAAWTATIYGVPPATEISDWKNFTLAEDYHQKYYLQSTSDLAAELRDIYPQTQEFTDSTAAARINGWLGGHGTMGDLRGSLDKLGLSERAGRLLISLALRAGIKT